MGKRWLVLSFFVAFGLLLLLRVASASCNNNGICEVGETNQFPPCYDCNNPYCGNGYCDTGVGEACSTCPQDCGVCNGGSCSSNGQCTSGSCCGAPSGVCVASIVCSPGDTQVCSTTPPTVQSCTSSCAWGSCHAVECTQSSQCTPSNPCLTSTCSGAPNYACTTPTPIGDGTQCGTNQRCRAGVCEVNCASPDFCTAPAPTYATLYDQYFCTDTQHCYGCNTGYNWNGTACVLSCTDVCSPSGQTRCDPSHANATQTCVTGSAGCLVWGASQACPAGQACSAGACVVTCTDACVLNAQQCSGNNVQTCGYYGSACLHWNTTASCAAPTPLCQQSGDTASCVACVSAPPDPSTVPCGQTQSYLLCTGATGSVTGTQCAAGSSCNASGQCVAGCTPTCTQSGATQCSGSSVQTCEGTTCLQWVTTASCVAPSPSCAVLAGGASCVQCTTSAQCGTGLSCDASGQCVASCVDACSSGSSGCSADATTPWVCGHTAVDACLHPVNQTACADWQVCNAGSCGDASVAITPGSAGAVVAGSWFTLSFTLSHESSSYLLQVPSWPVGATKSDTPGQRSTSGQPTNSDVGVHTVNLILHRVVGTTDTVVSQTSVNLNGEA